MILSLNDFAITLSLKSFCKKTLFSLKNYSVDNYSVDKILFPQAGLAKLAKFF